MLGHSCKIIMSIVHLARANQLLGWIQGIVTGQCLYSAYFKHVS